MGWPSCVHLRELGTAQLPTFDTVSNREQCRSHLDLLDLHMHRHSVSCGLLAQVCDD